MYKIKAYEQMRMKVNNNTKPNNKNDDQTKTKLSPQGPQRSRHFVVFFCLGRSPITTRPSLHLGRSPITTRPLFFFSIFG